MEKKREGVIDGTSRIVSDPYYFLHLMTFFSYLPIRSSASQYTSHRLFDRELQAFLAFLMFSAIKMVRKETWEAFVADSLLYAKIFLIAVTLIMDYRVAIWFTVIFSVIYLLAQQPAFSRLGIAKKLTPMQLEDLLSDGTTTKYWLIEFYACSSSKCVRSSRCFPDLSITYSNNLLSFGTIDLELFPNTAAKFGISLAGGMSQLPTYILFEKGVEVSRFPDFYVDATPSLPITKKLLCQYFELDRLLLDYINGS
uniref:Thioredoxin domain-containing protein n=1 Tax=Brassica campestris TaxID=3711 RepID=M4CXK1_BRACM